MRDRRRPESWGRGCRGKVAFRSKRQALGVLRTMRRKNRSPEHLNIYHCSCRYWHIGNSTPVPPKAPLRQIRALAGDVVEITWKLPDGTLVIDRRTVPELEVPLDQSACPVTGERDCEMCASEYCETHGRDPCDCDVVDRHEKRLTG